MGQRSGQRHTGAGVVANCPLYPHAGITPATGAAACLKPSLAFFAAIGSHPSIAANNLAHYRPSDSRSSQKRGPPEFLS
jgi:hypothetical protein